MFVVRILFLLVLIQMLPAQQQPKSEGELRADLDRALQEKNGGHALSAMLALDQFYRVHRQWNQQAEILNQIVYYWSKKIQKDSIGVARYSADLAEAHERAGDMADAEKEIQYAIHIFEKSGPQYAAANVRAKRVLYAILRRENKRDQADALEASLPPPHLPARWDQHPKVISKSEPDYTNAARKKRINGNISLSLMIDETGNPKEIEVTAPLGFGLDETAIEAVKTWRFSPALSGGRPISTYATIEVSFRLL